MVAVGRISFELSARYRRGPCHDEAYNIRALLPRTTLTHLPTKPLLPTRCLCSCCEQPARTTVHDEHENLFAGAFQRVLKYHVDKRRERNVFMKSDMKKKAVSPYQQTLHFFSIYPHQNHHPLNRSGSGVSFEMLHRCNAHYK